MTNSRTLFISYLTRATMIVAIAAAGISMQPAHAADATQAVRVVQLPTVTVVAKRLPVIRLERVVIVAKRLPATTVVAERSALAAPSI